jgi:hypothetical protein
MDLAERLKDNGIENHVSNEDINKVIEKTVYEYLGEVSVISSRQLDAAIKELAKNSKLSQYFRERHEYRGIARGCVERSSRIKRTRSRDAVKRYLEPYFKGFKIVLETDVRGKVVKSTFGNLVLYYRSEIKLKEYLLGRIKKVRPVMMVRFKVDPFDAQPIRYIIGDEAQSRTNQ